MRAIGNYAFYGYNKLKTVEFKSVVAPALESWYNSASDLVETDPGYELLHNQFELFGLELYYYNFIDLVGKKAPISMVLPANEDIKGYDSVVFEAYFGKVEDSVRSGYVAMEKNMIDFFAYVEKIAGVSVITLSHERLVNNALAAYNAMKQDPTQYGYTQEYWTESVRIVTEAKERIAALKLANANKTVQALQERINALPDLFKVSDLETLAALAADINALPLEDRVILDLTKYNAIMEQYNEYRATIDTEGQAVRQSLESSFANVGVLVAATATMLSAAAFVGMKNRLGF
jgi:hypothetical protein